MIARLTEDTYSPLLDELLKVYNSIGNSEPTKRKSLFAARKYVECTKYNLDEIIEKTRLKLRTCDFKFEGRCTNRLKNSFIVYFETFIAHVMLVIRYLQGHIKQI